jgi:hypothetical protein
MSADFVIIGGGCYGSYYVGQLLEARERGKLEWSRLLVLDRDPHCAVSERFDSDDVEIAVTHWEEWGDALFANPSQWLGRQLVPAPIAPHVVKHWLVRALAREGVRVDDARWDEAVPALPYADVTASGHLVLSHAPALCPTNCIEPRSCPLTGGPRTWDMPDTVRDAGAALDGLVVLECRHFAYGVGTIPFSRIHEAYTSLLGLPRPARAGVATVSGCHGLVDAIRLT